MLKQFKRGGEMNRPQATATLESVVFDPNELRTILERHQVNFIFM
jgi:hypothetical protein